MTYLHIRTRTLKAKLDELCALSQAIDALREAENGRLSRWRHYVLSQEELSNLQGNELELYRLIQQREKVSDEIAEILEI